MGRQDDREAIEIAFALLNHAWIVLRDSHTWMKTASRLFSEGQPQHHSWEGISKLNVAHTCTGYAFELLIKCLVAASSQQPEQIHCLRRLYECIEHDIQATINKIVVNQGWDTIDSFLRYLDERMTSPDRKYWGRNTKRRGGRVSGVGFAHVEPLTVGHLAKIHLELWEFASSLVWKKRMEAHTHLTVLYSKEKETAR